MALMYAVMNGSVNIVKLLLQQDIDVLSQDIYGCTAEEYAVTYGFVIIAQLISEHTDKNEAGNFSQYYRNSSPGKEHSEENSSNNKSGFDDSFPMLVDEDLDFDNKNAQKPSLINLKTAFEEYKKKKNIRAKCHIVRPGEGTLFEGSSSAGESEDVAETLPKPSVNSQGFCHEKSALNPALKSSAGLGLTKTGSEQTMVGKQENCNDAIQSVPKEKINNDNLTSDEAHKSTRHDTMSALGLEEEEDRESSPWDSEDLSDSLPPKKVGHFSGAPGPIEENILNKQVGDSHGQYLTWSLSSK